MLLKRAVPPKYKGIRGGTPKCCLNKNMNASRPSEHPPMLSFISHQLIRYESSRGHKIDGTKPNQTGNTLFGEKKQGKQTEGNGQESSQQKRTKSPGRDLEQTNKMK